MAVLTDAMKAMVQRTQLCYVATATPDGKPNLSPKGSLAVWDDNTLVFADIASPGTIANLEVNPAIEINIVDPFLRKGYRFAGRASVVSEGDTFRTVKDQLQRKHGPRLPVNHVVIVHVDRAASLISPAGTRA